ncbi:MAG TPA: T9SS type A sorting domain-containing protein [Ignavibacteria bacterium]|nr:T9SS type A sorting domain-containing protein [Ignavibacteria bacterium]
MKSYKKIFYLFIVLFITNVTKSHSQLVPDFRVNDDSTSTRSQYASKLSADRLGNFTVVWQDQRNNRPNVYAQRFDYNANFLGVNFRVNSIPDSAGRPSIAITKSGKIGITWLEINSTIPNSSKIKFRVFNSDGIPVSDEKVICDTTGNFMGFSSMGVNERSEFIISWNQKGVLYQIVDSVGNKIGNNILVNDNTVFAGQGDPAINVRVDNSFIITWSDTRPPSGGSADDIYFQMFDQFGTRIGVNQKVNDDVSTFNLQLAPKISSNELGEFLIAWYDDRLDNSHSEIFAQNYTNNGFKIGVNYRVSESFINYGKGICNVFQKPNGEFLIGWTESRPFISSPYFQRYDSSGIKIGNNFLVSSQFPGVNKSYSDFIIYNDKIISVWNDERNGPFDVYSNIRSFTNPDTTVNIIQTSSFIPENFTLYQNYPNPFNPTTLIYFDIKLSGIYKLEIFNNLGQNVKEIFHKSFNPGTYQLNFDANGLSSGIYYYILSSPKERFVKSLVLLK